MFATRQATRQPVSNTRLSRPAGLEQPSQAGLLLLGEVLARLAGVDRPIVQIISASASRGAGHVARDFAAAAATRFGRTLLVSPDEQSGREETGTRGLSWLMNGTLGGQPDGITPDISVPGLYYTTLGTQHPGPLDLPLDTWLAGPQGFAMIVIESSAIAEDPRTLATAARCHGCVLAVSAGATTLAEVHTAARQLASAGVVLLGTVLQDAPRLGMRLGMRLGFRRRAG